MQTITLGRSELEVSRIAFGTWQLGGQWGSFDEDTAIAAIRHARELGVTLFDTAQAYGAGAAEPTLLKALRQRTRKHDRDSVVIATKGGTKPRAELAPPRLPPRVAHPGCGQQLAACSASTTSTSTRSTGPTPRRRRRRSRRRCRSSSTPGKVRHIGVSNYTAAEPLAAFDETPARWRRCSRRTTCSAAASRPIRCPTAS